MKHEVTERGDTIIIALKGEIDLESSPVARELLLGSVTGKRNLLVDLSAVTYIDSSGVASMVEALQASKKNGTQFALARDSDMASPRANYVNDVVSPRIWKLGVIARPR